MSTATRYGYGVTRKTRASAQREADRWNASGDGVRTLLPARTYAAPHLPERYESVVADVEAVADGYRCRYTTTVEIPYDDARLSADFAKARQEILDDVRAGRVPADVNDFAVLHDYVDANEYGGLCDDNHDWTEDLSGVPLALSYGIRLQDLVHEWLKSGALALIIATDQNGK